MFGGEILALWRNHVCSSLHARCPGGLTEAHSPVYYSHWCQKGRVSRKLLLCCEDCWLQVAQGVSLFTSFCKIRCTLTVFSRICQSHPWLLVTVMGKKKQTTSSPFPPMGFACEDGASRSGHLTVLVVAAAGSCPLRLFPRLGRVLSTLTDWLCPAHSLQCPVR